MITPQHAIRNPMDTGRNHFRRTNRNGHGQHGKSSREGSMESFQSQESQRAVSGPGDSSRGATKPLRGGLPYNEYFRLRNASKIKARREAGLCGQCGTIPSLKFYCPDCAESRNQYQRARRLIRFRNCFCGKPATCFRFGNFYCDTHGENEKSRHQMSEREARESYLQSKREYSARIYRERKAQGLCICGRPAMQGVVACEKCRRWQGKINAPKQPSYNHPWKL